MTSESRNTKPKGSTERQCEDCGGRQVRLNTVLGLPVWVCTDTRCDRKDEVIQSAR